MRVSVITKKWSLIISLGLLSLIFTSCAGSREVQRRDNLGRVVRISYYEGSSIQRMEDISYYGTSHNPKKIFYMKKVGLNLVPVREESYIFKGKKLSKLSFYSYKDKKKIKVGIIKYYYAGNHPFRIEYYSYLRNYKKYFIFGLDQYSYRGRILHQRRIIEYELNRKTDKSMQIGQYVVHYKKGKIHYMQSWIMDKKSKKIVEKTEKNAELIDNKIAFIEQFYNNRARNSKYISD